MTTVVQDPEVFFVQIAGTNSNIYGLNRDGQVFQYFSEANLWLPLNNRTRDIGYSEFFELVGKEGSAGLKSNIKKEHEKHNYATRD